ncbi:DUF2975 domain-containing protein [Secundilactobacillus silagei]|uniref:DUF2975 domain-containing protein n=1 Tax=Secundilactobacillus silagei TaxID=1293415 RepID=UPI0006D0E450|nr:DUF2975 domain-containing protein [Secundilactobacillus silagei]
MVFAAVFAGSELFSHFTGRVAFFGGFPFTRFRLECQLQAYALTIGLYVSAISFIVLAVFAWQLLHLISQQLVFTAKTVQLFVALKWSCVGIQLGALTMLPGIYLVADRTDAPGVMAMGLIFYAVWLFMTVFFAILQRLWATAVAFKHVSNDSE